MVGALHRGGVRQVKQSQGCAQGTVLDPDRRGRPGLSSHVAAFVSNRGQFVVTIRQRRGVERESQGEIVCAGGDIEMVSGLEVGKVLCEGASGVGHDRDSSVRAFWDHFDSGSRKTGTPRAQIKGDVVPLVHEEILGDDTIGALQAGRSVDQAAELREEIGHGHGAGLVGQGDDHGLAICFGYCELEPGAGGRRAADRHVLQDAEGL